MLWHRYVDRICERGGEVITDAEVTRLHHAGGRIRQLAVQRADGTVEQHSTELVISTMPLRDLIARMDPAAPSKVREAASSLLYRDFVQVVLIVDDPEPFPDTWLYVHDADLRLGRVQNFKRWSADMVPYEDKTCVGLEFFCNRGDEFWHKHDQEIVDLGIEETSALGLLRPERVLAARVIRARDAYPVYDLQYKARTEAIREYLESIDNLQTAGRNGLHLYLTQDEAVLAGSMAVRAAQGHSVSPWSITTREH
jgi:protoporphyrinogen oxidase